MESRKNKDGYGDTHQIRFMKTNNGNNGGNDDDDESVTGMTPTTYDTQGQRGFHNSMKNKKYC